ncbi:MAG: hypothetical protein PHX61_12315, partial [Alphaproteobacteria bacterium]|nr:hypothetical protein [Alphaproteobacteria bacterium]
MELKKMIKNGNSMALVIERPLLEVLGANPNSFVKRTISGNKLILEFVNEGERTKLIDEAINTSLTDHATVFKKLAE